MTEEKVFRGPYAMMTCKHCQKPLEAGPRLLARWAWCIRCEGPVHNKASCNHRCPRRGAWDPLRDEDRVKQHVGGEPWLTK